MTADTIIIPDALPVLSRGNHKPGSGKACIMDALSTISGRPWEQDSPSCVHPLLRPLFITLNDSATDADRHRLWRPAMRALGTGVDEDLAGSEVQRLAVAVTLGQARRVLSGQRTADHGHAVLIRPLLAWQKRPGYATRRPVAVAMARVGRREPDCRGCRLLAGAAANVAAATSAADITHVYHGIVGWDEKLGVLDGVLDDWLRMLPPMPDVVPDDIPWDELKANLGTAVPTAPPVQIAGEG